MVNATNGHDRKLKFGTYLNSQLDVIDCARRIEAAGFDYLISGEHILFHGPRYSAISKLSAAAAVTDHIRLMTAVLLLPLYPAPMAAWMATTLDQISGGRLDLGIGVGGESKKEFELVGVPLSERGPRTDEAMRVLRLLWTAGPATFSGKFSNFVDMDLQPKPVQSHLPIWVAGRRPPAMRRAARYGDGWIPYMYSARRLAESARIIREEAEAVGRDPDEIQISIHASTAVYRDGDKARQVAAAHLERGYGQDLRHIIERSAIVGTPEDCRRRIEEYIDAGARTVVFLLACPPEDFYEMLELLTTEVIPHFS
jgi:probable F420-dependent oxidoreductase